MTNHNTAKNESAPAAKKKLSRSEFLAMHNTLRSLHPSLWEIEWDRLPKTIERDERDEPVYLKTGRNDLPDRIVVFHGKRLVSSLERNGHWVVMERDNLGRIEVYNNSLGCSISQYWGNSNLLHPIERMNAGHRWVLVSHLDKLAVYWCPKTDYFHFKNKIVSRQSLRYWFSTKDWDDREFANLINTALKMPVTFIGRWLWCFKNPMPEALHTAI